MGMFDYLKFDENGTKIISRADGANSNMLMDITVCRLKAGETVAVEEAEKETASCFRHQYMPWSLLYHA